MLSKTIVLYIITGMVSFLWQAEKDGLTAVALFHGFLWPVTLLFALPQALLRYLKSLLVLLNEEDKK